MKNIVLTTMFLVLPTLSFAADPSIADLGMGFGIGVEQYRQGSFIESASTNGNDRIVSIDKEYRTMPSAWLTANWNLWPREAVTLTKSGENYVEKIRYGLFAGAKLFDGNNSSAFSGFALGPQVSFLTKDKQFSIGVGWVTHQTKELGDGIVKGQPLPAYYNDIKYHERSENSYMLMFTVNLLNTQN